MIRLLLPVVFLACFLPGPVRAQYEFKKETKLPATSVKDQQKTGTCWSFATTSFLEAELLRVGKGEFDLSEMYSVRKVYEDKAYNYIMRHGKANFSQGSLAHDVLKTVNKYGIMPQEAYTGLVGTDSIYNHGELSAGMKGFLDGVLKNGKPGPHWKNALSGILDEYLGEVPETFTWNGKEYSPLAFVEELGLTPDDYVSITSFSHHPFGEYFILEIPDNYSNGEFLNLELEEFTELIDHAVEKGFTLAWDGDVGETGFSGEKGLALLHRPKEKDSLINSAVEGMAVSQKKRQECFEGFLTTDDHLMHLTGRAVDPDGKVFYIIKNSWGEKGPYKGYLYMSEAYVKMKTMFVVVHKDALPAKTAAKLKN